MSDTVQLIIEIPTGGAFERDIYTPICAEGFIRDEYNEKVAEAIKNGIPLDSVKAEIKEKCDSWEKDGYLDEADALNVALKIIDKHIGKAESEDKE